jgi:hypothetical protein
MLQRYLAAVFQGPAIREKAPIRIRDASGHGGQLSAIWTDLLGQLGFKVADGGAVSARSSTTFVDGTGGRARHTLSFLGSFFGAQPASASAPAAGEIDLTLGRDAGNAFYEGGSGASVSESSGGTREPAPTPTGGQGGVPEPGSGDTGGGGGGGHHLPSPPPLPLPSLLPKPP